MTLISRSEKPLKLLALHFETWSQVEEELDTGRLTETCVFGDLSLGAWKGHWLIVELSRQLGLNYDAQIQPAIGYSVAANAQADIISNLIDNESEGDVNISKAYQECKRLIEAMVSHKLKWVIIMPPQEGYHWENEDLQMIYFLHHGLMATEIRLLLLWTPGCHAPASWELSFQNQPQKVTSRGQCCPVPGLIAPEVAAALNYITPSFCLQMPCGYWVIPPTMRVSSGQGEDLSEMENILADYPELQSKIILEDRGIATDLELLQAESIKRFSEGGYGIALRILSHTRPLVQSALQLAIVTSLMQNIRIALLYFEQAAAETWNEASIPEFHQAFLLQTKAWGLVMTGKPKLAEPLFERARGLFPRNELPRTYLYLLNISALNQLKLGRIENAFAFEKEIDERLSEMEFTDWHVLYINAINQARLYKKVEDYSTSLTYYLKAFDVNRNLKTESDLLYTNLCLAQLEGLMGREEQALLSWIRVCIHWLSNELPEALAPRVAQAIMKKKLSAVGLHVEEVSQALFAALEGAIQASNLSVLWQKRSVTFLRVGAFDEMPGAAIGAPGLGLFVSDRCVQDKYSGKAYTKLKTLTYSVLCAFVPGLEQYPTILTDTQLDEEIPWTRHQLINVCLRLKVSSVVYRGEHFMLQSHDELNLLMSSRVITGSAIAYLALYKGTVMAHYKRYRLPRTLTEVENKLILMSQEGPTVLEIYRRFDEDFDIIHTLRKLENDRLINIRLDEG